MAVNVDKAIEDLSGAFEGADEGALRNKLESLVERAQKAGKSEADVTQLLSDWLEGLPRRRSNFRTVQEALADLATWLGAANAVGRTVRNVADALLDHYPVALTALAGLATAFYGLAYAAFYRALDSSPEQVGVTATQVLARSAVGGIACVAVFGFLLFLLIAPFAPPAVALDAPASRFGTRNVLGGQVALSLACFAGLSLLVFLLETPAPTDFLIYFVCIVVAPLLLTLRHQKGVGFRVAPLQFKSSMFGGALLISLAASLAILGVFTVATASEEAKRARNGERVEAIEFAGIPLLHLGARPATLTWQNGAPEGLSLPRCVVYLGHSESTATVYDPKQRRTMQLPEKDVIVTVRRDRSSCSAPTNTDRPHVVARKNGDLECRRGHWKSQLPSDFNYSWITETLEFGPFDRARFEMRPDEPIYTIRCAVEAETELGWDTAYSRFYFPVREATPAHIDAARVAKPRPN